MTPQGAEFVAKARAVLSQADDLEAMAKAWTTTAPTEVVLGALPMSLAIIEPLVAGLAAAHPHVRVSFRVLDFTTQRAELRRGHIDVEIACPMTTSNEFGVIELARVPRVVWLASDHALAKQSQLTMEQVRDLPVPGRHPDVPEEWWDELFCKRQRIKPPRSVDRRPRSPEEIWPLVASGEAISISPQYVAGHFPGAVPIPIIDAEPLSVALLHRLGDQRPVIKAIAAVAVDPAVDIGLGARAVKRPREVRD